MLIDALYKKWTILTILYSCLEQCLHVPKQMSSGDDVITESGLELIGHHPWSARCRFCSMAEHGVWTPASVDCWQQSISLKKFNPISLNLIIYNAETQDQP